MKKLFLILLIFMSLTSFAQMQVKENSFHQIDGYVMLDKNDHYDDNNLPMALIKISTENITAEERRHITFKGNLATYFDVHFEPSEIYLYISAQSATFIEIHHPDYGKTEFTLPFDLKDFCGYEMVLQYIPIGLNTNVTQQNNYLTIICDQPNASIYIDDQYVSDGFKSLAIGTTHSWRIECDMYHTESGTVTITKDEPITIEKQLRPAYGFIKVSSKPESGAIVFINNKKVGTTPYQSDKMASGTYNIRVVKDMYKTIEQTFTITDGNTTDALLDMAANFINLTVETDPDSDIYIDEQLKGKGKWSGRISDGAHFVEVKKDKHRTVSKNLNLVLGKDEVIKIEAPAPIVGMLDISSLPVKANIYLNGKHYGATPRIISDLLIGDYTLKLEKEGCASVTKNITIEENQTLTIKENLPTGKEVVIKTDQSGDKIYVDDSYIGISPITTNLSYGSHNIKAVRDSQIAVKTVEVKTTTVKDEFVLAFGKMINITSNQKGDDIYVDGKKVGTTPMEIDFSLGKHEVEVRRGKLYEKKDLQVTKNGVSGSHFVPKKEPLDKYLSRGVNFVTLNAAYSVAPQTSFGFTYGQVKNFGWFVSAMSNFGFKFKARAWNDMYSSDEVVFSGKSSKSRLSLTGGMLLRLWSPAYLKLGVGYGVRTKCWEVNGSWYEYTPDTYKGIDLTAGLMFNTRGCTLSADVVTTNFKTLEIKLGIGMNWNR